MAIKKTLDRNAILRFADIPSGVLDEKLAGTIYRHRFPVKFARGLIKGVWRARHVPDLKRPRLKMRDVYAALGMGYGTLRKWLASGDFGTIRYDLSGNVLLSLEQFFAIATKKGKKEWLPDNGPGR